MSSLIGRDGEAASVRAFIGETEAAPAALVLEGEPGIGKTTLWLAGVEHARESGQRVLLSRPAPAELSLAHVGLGDLFDGVIDDVLGELAPPRRRALEGALLRAEPQPGAVDPRALGIATRSVLELLGNDAPLLVAVDDLQWLDASSAAALAFALRRLDGTGVRLLLARRSAPPSGRSALEDALAPERVQRVSLGPLSVGALHQLLRDRMRRPFARQTLLRIHERSGGNPFFALELARVLDEEVDSLRPLPVPETLEELVRARIDALAAPTRNALALASALGTPSESLLERAGIGHDVLEPAVTARVIERENGIVRFTHPLLSSVLYQDLGRRRLEVHAQAADVVDDPLLRARHLALSREAPDADVAAVLEDASSHAVDRGALPVAAALADHALRLTPPERRDEHRRRALDAARAHHAAGEWTRARTLATDLLRQPIRGSLRVESLLLLAELEGPDRSAALLEEALQAASSDAALQALVHVRLAWAARFRDGWPRASEHARAALSLAERLDDDALRVRALTMLATFGAVAGDADAPARIARARELVPPADGELVKQVVAAEAGVLLWSLRIDEARAVLERAYDEWCARDELWSSQALWSLSLVEWWAGRWELAAQRAAAAHDVAVQYGLELPQHLLPIALVAVHRGRLEDARALSERALELAEEQFSLRPPVHLAVIGLAALWRGDAATAAAWLAEADEQAASLGWGEPSHRLWTADYAEALLDLGRIDDAVRVVDVWEADALRLGRERLLAHVARCRGLVAAARADVGGAVLLLEHAVAEHERFSDVYGRARAQLALGVVRRRARQKRAAREAIVAALGGFEELGAATWAERARRELASIGGRTREDGLTGAERRVAVLVAEGRTNREVAAALFLGERTVASHLTRIYAKLGVRSRTELARKVQTF